VSNAQRGQITGAAGLGPQEITALTSDSHSAAGNFSDTGRAVLELTTQLLTTHRATAAALGDVYKALGADAIIEILIVISRWAGLALMLNALEVDLDETHAWRAPL